MIYIAWRPKIENELFQYIVWQSLFNVLNYMYVDTLSYLELWTPKLLIYFYTDLKL